MARLNRVQTWQAVRLQQIEGPGGDWLCQVRPLGQIGAASPEKALAAAQRKWPLVPRGTVAIQHERNEK
jgi:hypothetical protein